jgi:hypothetical protein
MTRQPTTAERHHATSRARDYAIRCGLTPEETTQLVDALLGLTTPDDLAAWHGRLA